VPARLCTTCQQSTVGRLSGRFQAARACDAFQARDFATDYKDQLTVVSSLFSVLGLDQHSCGPRHDGVDPSFLLARTTEAAPSLRFRAGCGPASPHGPRAVRDET